MEKPLLILGSGAIGGTIGAYIARSGSDVLMVNTVAEHVEAMNSEDLSIKGPVDEFTTAIRALTLNQISGVFKRLLLCVKL